MAEATGENVNLQSQGETGVKVVWEIRMRDPDGDVIQFKVKPTTKLQKVLLKYCAKKELQQHEARLLFDGQELVPDNKEISLQQAGLQNEDQIDYMTPQQGGNSPGGH